VPYGGVTLLGAPDAGHYPGGNSPLNRGTDRTVLVDLRRPGRQGLVVLTDRGHLAG
jgi:hypothetical protein